MTQKKPKIASLQPVVLPDQRRVTLELAVEHLPTLFSNVTFMVDTPPAQPAKPNPDAPSPYPNLELSILDSQRQEVASLFIIEHREPFTSLTLHLRTAQPAGQYTARAEMTYMDEIIDVVETPFTLNQVD